MGSLYNILSLDHAFLSRSGIRSLREGKMHNILENIGRIYRGVIYGAIYY